MAKQPISALRRTAGEVKRYRVLLRLTPMVLGAMTMTLILIYVIAVLYGKYGSFTVAVQKYDAMKYALSLDDTPDFDDPTSRLNFKFIKDITNISGDSLPLDLDHIDGEHSGMNYAAYTYYCKNAGVETVTYRYQMYIANMTLGMEKAVRIRLYVDGEPETYARTACDGSGPEPGTVEFKTETIVVEGDVEHFAPGDYTKFTVVIWLEGDDPECLDDIIGGEMKVAMTMSVLEVEATKK